MPASLPEDWMLYAAAILFALVLVGSIIAAVSNRRSSRRKGRGDSLPSALAAGAPSDGIVSPVRPRGTVSQEDGKPEGPPPPVPGSAPSAPKTVTPEPDTPTLQQLTKSVARVRSETPRDPDSVTPEQAAFAARAHLVKSLLFSSGAQTICVLRHQDGRYTVVQMASRNVFAHGPASKRSFLDRTALGPDEAGEIARYRVGSQLTRSALQYYKEELDIREVVSTRFRLGGVDHLLLADTVDEGTLDGERIERLLLSTAHAMEIASGDVDTFKPLPPIAKPAAATKAKETPQIATTDTLDVPISDDTPLRPRRDIIAEELDIEGPFALAMLHLAEEEGESVEPSEERDARFEASVREIAAGHRVEVFGELQYGVFVRDSVDAIEAWIGAAHQALNAPEGTRVIVGGALRGEDTSPDLLREDATAALEAAYREGEPILYS